MRRSVAERKSWAIVAVAMVLTGATMGCARGDTTVDAQNQSGTKAPPLSLMAPGSTGSGSGSNGTAIGSGIGARISPSATADYLGKVADQTKQINTGMFHIVTTVTGGTGHEGTTTLSELDGAFDKDKGTSRLKLDESGAAAAGASGLSALGGGKPIEMILLGTTGYLKLDLLGVGDGAWTKIDDVDQGSLKMVFDMFKVEDIAGFLDSLRCAGMVSEVGREPVDQVSTTHYRADVDTVKLDTCRQSDPNAGQLLSNFGDATTGTVEVWVDDNSLVRKLVNTADARALGTDLAAKFPGGTSTLTMTLTGFGDPVTIQAPPDDQVDTGGLGGLDGLLGGSDPLG